MRTKVKEEEKDRKIHQAAEAKRLKIEGKNILSEVGTILSISYKGSTEQNVHLFEPTPLVVLNYIYIYISIFYWAFSIMEYSVCELICREINLNRKIKRNI